MLDIKDGGGFSCEFFFSRFSTYQWTIADKSSLEGIATVVVAIASFWMLYDYPDTAKFLTPDERTFLQKRLLLDNDGCSHEFKLKFVKDAFLDWKVWAVSPFYRNLIDNS